MTCSEISVVSTYLDGNATLYSLPRHSDERGTLVPVDLAELPFQAVRAFLVRDVPAVTSRGGHAHCDTRQLIVLASGSVRIELRSGGEEVAIVLDESRNAVLIEPTVWSRQTYLTANSSIIVLADREYDPASYLPGEER